MVANVMVRKPAKVPKPNMATKKMAYEDFLEASARRRRCRGRESRRGQGAMIARGADADRDRQRDAGDGGADRHGDAFLQAEDDVVRARRKVRDAGNPAMNSPPRSSPSPAAPSSRSIEPSASAR